MSITSGLAIERIALDQASVRSYDPDGRLHVQVANLSKAAVNPYYGREIPGAQEMGLDPNRPYRMLRHPDELAKAVPSFNALPLLRAHVPVSADKPRPDMVVGAIGTNADWAAPFLRNGLVVWDASAIARVDNGKQKELSCAYRYRADMTPGEWEGQAYDGVMRDIVGNHVALVEEGRAGPECVVGDSNPRKETFRMKANTRPSLSPVAARAHGALISYLGPKLAQDANVDLRPMLAGVTGKTWKAAKPALVGALAIATRGKLAQDADIADVVDLLDKLDDEAVEGDPAPAEDDDTDSDPDAGDPTAEDDGDPTESIIGLLKGKLSDEDLAKVVAILKGMSAGAAATDKDETTPGAEPVTKAAMDAAVAKAARAAEAATMARLSEIRRAEDECRPFIGTIRVAMDSAASIYAMALKAQGIDLQGIPETAYRHMVSVLPKPGASAKATTTAVSAMDAAASKDFESRFPDAGRIRQA